MGLAYIQRIEYFNNAVIFIKELNHILRGYAFGIGLTIDGDLYITSLNFTYISISITSTLTH